MEKLTVRDGNTYYDYNVYHDQCEGDCIAFDLIGKLVKLKKPYKREGKVHTWGVIKDHFHNWRGGFVFGLYLMTDKGEPYKWPHMFPRVDFTLKKFKVQDF